MAPVTVQFACSWHSGGMEQPAPSSDARPSDEQLSCSAKGCSEAAAYAVVWNNPKVHTPEREKTWLACEQHRDFLSDFVDRRGFLLRVDTL